MLGKGFYAHLTDNMIAGADAIGRKRRAWNVAKGHKGSNNLNVSADQNLQIDIMGARCERAGWVFLPMLPWNGFTEHWTPNQPDLGDFIDVKGIRHDAHHLQVANEIAKDGQPRLKKNWAYLLVSAENHPYYWIAGWRWGEEIERDGEECEPQPGRPCFRWPRDKPLYSIMKLKEIALERANACRPNQ